VSEYFGDGNEHKEERISPPANISSFSRALLYQINNLVG
jgi:hypothetical protein